MTATRGEQLVAGEGQDRDRRGRVHLASSWPSLARQTVTVPPASPVANSRPSGLQTARVRLCWRGSFTSSTAVLVVDAERTVAARDEQPVARRREARGDDAAADPHDAFARASRAGSSAARSPPPSGSELRRLQGAREARRGIRRDVGEGLCRQLARVRATRLCARGAALHEREDGDRADDDERDERRRDERAQTPALPPRERRARARARSPARHARSGSASTSWKIS